MISEIDGGFSTASGTITGAAQSVTLANVIVQSQVGLQVTGTWVATLVFEATVDGTNWDTVPAVRVSDNTVVTQTTTNGIFRIAAGGFHSIRARSSAYTSGTATISIRASLGSQGAADTTPVSATSLPLPTGAATSALQTQPGVDIGDVTVNNAGGASAVNIQDGGNSLTVDGPLTDTELRATAVPISVATLPLPTGAATSANQTTIIGHVDGIEGLLTSIKDTDGIKKIADQLPAGTNNIGDVDVVSSALPTGASTLAEQQTQTTALQLIDDTVHAANAVFSKAIAVGGVLDDTAPVVATEGNVSPARLTAPRAWHVNLRDNAGTEIGTTADPVTIDTAQLPAALVGNRLDANVGAWMGSTVPTVGQKSMANSVPVTFAADQTALPVTFTQAGAVTGVSGAFLTLGGGTAGTLQVLRATAYTEPTSAAQRSIASSSANDTSAGTGARTVRITYFDNTGTGPLTETVTLNGTTAVNTTATNIRFIESLVVVTAGSGLVNAGTITLYGSTGGGGGTVGSIGVGNLVSGSGDNQTFWAHHYTAAGYTVELATLVAGLQSGGSATSGRCFLKSAHPLTANGAEDVVGGVVLVEGAFQRSFIYSAKVDGFVRITAYAIPTVNNATVSVTFDWSENVTV